MASMPESQRPRASITSVVRTGAGHPVAFELTVQNTAAAPRMLSVSVLGLDSSWLPLPTNIGPVPAGATVTVELFLSPRAGTVPARYPFAVAVQASDPATATNASDPTLVDGSLIVDEASRLSLEVTPAESSAVFGRRVQVLLRNTGGTEARVELSTDVADGVEVMLNRHRVTVPASSEVRLRGRVRISRPRLFGQRIRHPYLIGARGLGAPSSASGSLTSRPMLGGTSSKIIAAIVVVGLWATLAVVGIPKLASSVRGRQAKPARVANAGTANPSGSGSGSPGASSGAGGAGSGAGSGSPSRPGAAAAAAAAGVRLNGTVRGAAPGGVTVSLTPTSLVDEAAVGAQPVGESARSMHAELLPVGKIAAEQVTLRTLTAVSLNRATQTTADGSWSFAGIGSPGYYLLTFTKAGYQTRKYIINAADADAAQPLPVTLTAGNGSLSGSITGPSGPVGGASLTISDGSNTISTSSASKGSVGQWKVDGLSTPGTFLVSASRDGLGLESALVTLGAGGSQTVDLTLRPGVASLVGTVRGTDSLGAVVGLGGASVTATDGKLTRTATTVTAGPIGSYTLPALPVPGTYTVTVAQDGYLPQTQQITLHKGDSRAVIGATLTPSTSVVQGSVLDGADVGLVGAGMVLTGQNSTYKTMSVSSPLGSFRFNGVAPGTYVLGAELFGRVTGYATVHATVGKVASVTIKLAEVPGGTLPANSHVRGRVADARTGGPLTCDQAPGYDPSTPTSPANLALCKITVAVDDVRDDGTHHFTVPGVDPTLEYTIPSTEVVPPATAVDGLLPGLHHLTISAPGYETTTVDVQVPLSGIVLAPQVALYPTATILGTVTATSGNPATGPDPAFPDDPDEAIPAGQDYAHQKTYRTCVLAISTASPNANTAPPCTVDPAVLTGCTSSSGVYCALTAVADGSFSVRGLQHGAYVVHIRPLNPEYQNIPGTQVILDRGETKRYDATVHRLGRVLLSVLVPNASGGLVNAAGVTVTVAGPTNQNGLTAGVAGRLRVVGLASGNYLITADDGTHHGSTNVTVGSDQEAGALLTMTQPIGVLVGRVTSSVSGSAQGVGSATVTVSGITGYSGSTAQRNGATVTTRADGCFAITPDGNAPTVQVDPACPSPSTIPVGKLSLVIGQADLTVTAPNYDGFTSTSQPVSSAALLRINLQPSAQAISGTLTINPADSAVDMSAASIQVTRKAVGAGTVDVRAAFDGTLTWQDSNYPDPNRVRPGDYTLVASLAGYASQQITFTCALGVACAVPTFTLPKLGSLTISSVDGSSAAVPGAVFTLSGGGTGVVTQSPAPGSNTVTFGNLTPGQAYAVHIQAAGFTFASTGSGVTVDCAGAPSIVISPGATTFCDATLTRLGAIVGTTNAVLGSINQPLGNVLLTATYCGAAATSAADCVPSGAPFTAVSQADGTYRITGTNTRQGLTAGGWSVVASATGYASTTTYVQVAAADVTQDISLSVTPVTLQLGVQKSSSQLSTDLITDATVVLIDNGGTSIPPTALPGSTNGNRYVFAGLIPSTYSLQVTGSNFGTVNLQVTLLVGVPTQNIYIRTDVRNNTVAGSVTGVQGANPAAQALNGVSVQLGKKSGNTFTVSAGADGHNLSTTTGSAGDPGNADGYFSFSAVPDGSYVVQFTRDGYQLDDTHSVTVQGGQIAPALNVNLARVLHNVTVNVTSVNGFSIANAVVHLDPVDPNPTVGTQPLVSGSGPPNLFTAPFLQVPSGVWSVWIALPTNHFGQVLSSGGTPVTVTQSAPFQITVSGAQSGSDTTAAFTVTEGQLRLKALATPLGTDTVPFSGVHFTVSSGATAIYDEPSFTVATASSSSTTDIWVTPGPYTAKADPGASRLPAWPANSIAVTATSSSTAVAATVPLNEVGTTLNVTVTQGGAALTGSTVATVTLTSLDGATAPAAKSTGTGANLGKVSFTALPPGQWQVQATIGAKTSPQQTVTIATATATAQTTTVDVAP
jgi:hypothetical protein